MAQVFEFSDRIYLGTIADISGLTSEPSDPPSSTNAIENVFTFNSDGTNSVKMRFNVLELDFDGIVPVSVNVVPYHSRQNPAGYNWGTTEIADKWVSLGGQGILKVPTENGGNSIEVRMRGAKWITFKVKDASGVGAIPVKVYGLTMLQNVS